MRQVLTLGLLLTICFTTSGQEFLSRKALTFYPGSYIDTEYRYTDSTGMNLIVQNSFRKGGGYTDPTGKSFFSAIYWYRIINNSAAPLDLTITFPADSLPTLPSSDSYLKVFLPLDTMTVDKETLYAYGATRLNSFLDAGLRKPTLLQRTIPPGEVVQFYISALYHKAEAPARAKLIIKDQKIFYKIGVEEIPCGQITLTIK